MLIKTRSTDVVDFVKRFKSDESGSTAIEYGLMSGLIALMVISGASALGGSITQTFDEISSLMDGPAEIPQASGRGNG